ncbi:hypothetical protein B7R21_06325 [Subtercola boreus]|uniref:DUF3168 domain-containing protein n=1 Tax=Subtercola boreus TaxID=120213 RepID=A0A3E0VYZ3_9MICO|nr:hypothetical protein [Subtercola boreus]RFA14558.1 hypothetical protein B7R21_06325 [Subtercola boreus]
MSRKHTAALVALVSTSKVTNFYPGLAPLVDGKPQAGPYAVFYAQAGTDEATRFTGPATMQKPRWTIHAVGSTADQAEWVNEQIKSVLVPGGRAITPTVAGENPGRFWFSNPQPVQRDDDSSPPLFYVVAECGFSSELL